MRRLGLTPGEKVLDSCAGTGVLSLVMAQAVGPTGRVTAIDTSEPGLARLSAKIRQFAIGNIDVHAMTGAPLDFRRDYFHAVACSLASDVPSDPVRVALEWRRVLRPGGRVALGVLAHTAFQPLAGQLHRALVELGHEPADLAWIRNGRADIVAAVLRDAGFDDVAVETAALGYHLPDARAWWQVVLFGPLRAWLSPLSETQLDALRAAHLAEVGRRVTADGLWLDVPVLIARGAKPAN